MRNWIVIAILVGAQCSLLAGEQVVVHAEIVQRLHADSQSSGKPDQYALVLSIENANASEIMLPTQGYSYFSRIKGGELEMNVAFPPDKVRYGKRVVRSGADYHPVTIRRGEIAEVVIDFLKSDSLRPDFGVKFVFSIDENVAGRYLFWHGSVEGRALYKP